MFDVQFPTNRKSRLSARDVMSMLLFVPSAVKRDAERLAQSKTLSHYLARLPPRQRLGLRQPPTAFGPHASAKLDVAIPRQKRIIANSSAESIEG
jgi:hypothetical protein